MLDRLIASRIFKNKKSLLLLGPRQVGKSTLIRSLQPEKIINLADEAAYIQYSKDPSLFRREIFAVKNINHVFVDEIQRLPSLLNTIQSILDEGSKIQFFLSGSSARKLKKGGANLLPGRVLFEYLDPLTFWELGEKFDLEKSLQRGNLPGVYLDDSEGLEILSSYANLYLREEVQAEGLIKNLGAYARFLDVAAQASGEWINYSKLSNDAEIPKETLRRFFSILEETLLVVRLPSYRAHHSSRRLSQKDRIIFFDIGVRNALLNIHDSTISPQEKGLLFEQWLFLQCYYYSRANHKNWKFSSYRTDAGAEVDFVVDRGSSLVGVECKYGKNVGVTDFRGLRSLEEVANKPIEKWVVYQGSSKQKFSKNEWACPYQEFLGDVIPSL